MKLIFLKMKKHKLSAGNLNTKKKKTIILIKCFFLFVVFFLIQKGVDFL